MTTLNTIRARLGLPADVCAIQFVVREQDTSVTAYHRRESGEVDMTEVEIGGFLPTLTPSRLTVPWGSIDADTGAAYDLSGVLIPLSKRETQVLQRLAQTPGELVTHEDILNIDYMMGDDTQAARVWISRVRAKIGDVDKTYITGHNGVGYRLVVA